ncbi:hypothetical protein YSA_08358 [Pseudomonas putida ND6]|uniref:Uncharacterized protein n=1 Tax=Pseudomonas putida ND6 TaxID=231023 RepID=I3V0L7_PSEPU|nr:hypothetical protein YSA_08358 [Pseudomonas putida ND6]
MVGRDIGVFGLKLFLWENSSEGSYLNLIMFFGAYFFF